MDWEAREGRHLGTQIVLRKNIIFLQMRAVVCRAAVGATRPVRTFPLPCPLPPPTPAQPQVLVTPGRVVALARAAAAAVEGAGDQVTSSHLTSHLVFTDSANPSEHLVQFIVIPDTS